MSERSGSRRAFLTLGLKACAIAVPVAAAVLAQPKSAKAESTPSDYRWRARRRRWWW